MITLTENQLMTIQCALLDASEAQGDVPLWNKGGAGYRAARIIRELVDRLEKQQGR